MDLFNDSLAIQILQDVSPEDIIHNNCALALQDHPKLLLAFHQLGHHGLILSSYWFVAPHQVLLGV